MQVTYINSVLEKLPFSEHDWFLQFKEHKKVKILPEFECPFLVDYDYYETPGNFSAALFHTVPTINLSKKRCSGKLTERR